MAIFTPLTPDQITTLLDHYSIGTLVVYDGIMQGVDNTNYKITTTQDKYILTIFESRIDPNDIPYFLGFMEHLSRQNIICPAPVLRRDSKHISILADKPACFFTFLEGDNLIPSDITPALCAELGTLLARLHIAGQSFGQTRINSMGYAAWETRIQKVGTKADDIAPHLEQLLGDELAFLKSHWPQDLPSGNIHADLFPDNVFQKDGHLYGVIDFYFSATDFLAYDLAITLNAWCFENGLINTQKRDALINAYSQLRPLTAVEKNTFSIIARGAALRFLSSRLYDLVFHDPKYQVTPKDPCEYIKILQYHINNEVFKSGS